MMAGERLPLTATIVAALALGACVGAVKEEPRPAAEAAEAGPPAAQEQAPAAPAPEPRPSPAVKPSSRPAPAPSAPTVPRQTEAAPPPDGVTPEPPPAPVIREVTIPEGAILELELLTAMDTALSRVGDEIEAKTLSPAQVKGEVVLPKGTRVEGRVTNVQSSGRVKGRAELAFTFDRLVTRSGSKKIATSYVEKEAAAGHKKDATVIGGAAGVGAIIGAVVGGKKGAAIGATIGGASGTGVVLATKGEEIRLPVGTEVNVRLDRPLVVTVN